MTRPAWSLLILAGMLTTPAVIEHPVTWLARAFALLIITALAITWAYDRLARRGWWSA